MAEPYKHIYRVDLNQPLVRRDVGILATFDSKANRFGAELFRDGVAVNNLSGCTVTGYVIRPNEETVQNPGVVSGNQVYVDLLPACYLYDGAFELTLKIKQGDVEQAVLMCYGTVERSRTDATINGGDVIVTVNNAEMLGGKPPEAYSAVNLLDNAYFKRKSEIVNQRGKTTYEYGNADKYMFDRWSGVPGMKVEDGYVTVWNQNASTIYNLYQNFEVGTFDPNKTYTAAVMLRDGTLHVGSGKPKTGANQTVIVAGAFSVSFGYNRNGVDDFCIGVNPGSSFDMAWAVLYEGEYTEETLPPCAPKGYAAELMECQRYYWRIDFSWAGLTTITRRNQTSFRGAIVFPIPMRIEGASCNITNLNVVNGTVMVAESGNIVISNITYTVKKDTVFLTVVLAEATDEKAGIIYGGASGCIFEVSAEL